MTDETEKTTTEPVVVAPVIETVVKEPESIIPETKESVIARIATKIKNAVTGGPEEVGDFIPDKFSEAALAQGWTDEDIEDFASNYTDEELLEMLPSLLGETSVKTETNSDKVVTPETKDVKVDNSQDDEKTKKLMARIEALEKAQGKSSEETEQQKLTGLVHRASQTFDDVSKEFEVFGKTEELPRFPDGRIVPTSPQMKARNEVWDLAYHLHKTGMDFDNAMSISLNSYKGKNLAKDVKRSMIKDLKNREIKLSGKRTNHETTAVIQSGPEVIREVARRHGREIN